MPIRGIGKMKLERLEKELNKLKQELKDWDVVNKKGVVGTTNHVLPLKIAKDIAEYEKQIEKLKAKKTGGRRTRSTTGRGTRRHTRRGRGGNPKSGTQRSPYLTYDKYLSAADAAKEAAQAEKDRENAKAALERYKEKAKQPYSPIADVSNPFYSITRLQVARKRQEERALQNGTRAPNGNTT